MLRSSQFTVRPCGARLLQTVALLHSHCVCKDIREECSQEGHMVSCGSIQLHRLACE